MRYYTSLFKWCFLSICWSFTLNKLTKLVTSWIRWFTRCRSKLMILMALAHTSDPGYNDAFLIKMDCAVIVLCFVFEDKSKSKRWPALCVVFYAATTQRRARGTNCKSSVIYSLIESSTGVLNRYFRIFIVLRCVAIWQRCGRRPSAELTAALINQVQAHYES